MRLRRVADVVAAVPLGAPWSSMAAVGGAGLLLVGLANGGSATLRLRMSAVAVAAATAWLLDDPATATLASSPTPLVARRGIRMALAASFVAGWWAVATVLAGVRVQDLPVAALGREVALLAALAALGAVAAQRLSGDGRGGTAGAVVAIGWFALSFLPRLGALPLPPDPLRPGSAGPLLTCLVATMGLVLLLSADPAAPPILRPRRRG